MKKISILLVALAFTFATSVSANSTDPDNSVEPKSKISKQISKLLENPYFSIEKTLEAEVTFMLNDNDEIVVLSVNTDNKIVEKYIKARLNYNKLNMEELEEKSDEYKVMIRIQEEV